MVTFLHEEGDARNQSSASVTGGGGGEGRMELFIYDLKVGSAKSDLRTESIFVSDLRIK